MNEYERQIEAELEDQAEFLRTYPPAKAHINWSSIALGVFLAFAAFVLVIHPIYSLLEPR